jgi:hypothetical protein
MPIWRSSSSETHSVAAMITSRSLRFTVVATMLATAVIALAGCTTAASMTPSPNAKPTSNTTPSSAAAQSPSLNPGGSAADNQAFFDRVNQRVATANVDAGGIEFTSALRDHGFDVNAMQVTRGRHHRRRQSRRHPVLRPLGRGLPHRPDAPHHLVIPT